VRVRRSGRAALLSPIGKRKLTGAKGRAPQDRGTPTGYATTPGQKPGLLASGTDPDEISVIQMYREGTSEGPGSGMCADQERQTPPRIVTAAIKNPGQQG